MGNLGIGADTLLKIDTIDGESGQDGHEKWIEITSWSWGAKNAGSNAIGRGGGSGRVSMQDFHFVMQYGISSPKLFGACCTGQHIAYAVLHLRKAGGAQRTYMEWKFSDIIISSYRTVGAEEENHKGTNPLPLDKVSFNFTKLELGYKAQAKDGSLGASWMAGFDVKTGTKV